MICKYIFNRDYKLKFVSVKIPKDNEKEILEKERKHIFENEIMLKKIYG